MAAVINATAQVSFVENHHQWNEQVLYQADIHSGRAFFGPSKITYAYYSSDDVNRAHLQERDSIREDGPDVDARIRCHAYEVEFTGAQSAVVAGNRQKNYSNNYFTGKDVTHWAGNVPVYESLEYTGIYPGVNIHYYGEGNQLKYDFSVAAGSDPTVIAMNYSGQRSMRLVKGELFLDLGFTSIKEIIPSAYQLINGKKQEVTCRFSLTGNTVRFIFPHGYNSDYELIIDPVVVAATYSGGTGISGGLCATYDDDGNIYSGGNAFSIGFPATIGAYDVSYNGSADLAISKYNTDGSTLLYCTYVGGSSAEYPESMIVSNGILYVYGTTYSGDFPVTSQAYAQAMNGNSDMFICCLNSNGSALLASTFIGGSSYDGTSYIAPYFADRLRGEIQVAKNGDILVAGSALSVNFPTTSGAYSTSSGGGSDAVVFRMDATLSNLIWSTYLGSGVHDAALGIKEADDGSVYVCGATNNRLGPFPTVAGCYETVAMGGADAFIAKLNSSGTTLLASTLFGGTGVDVAYFLDLDKDGDVYILGMSRDAPAATPGTYSINGGLIFVAKFNGGLTDLVYTTHFGGNGSPAVVVSGPTLPGPPGLGGPAPLRPNLNALTAFKVDKCERLYIAGYCGPERWETTPDALYEYTADNQFCVSVLEQDATALLSSTMLPGLHVDGGSGRFDKDGVLYQAACIGDSYFPTPSWAFSDGSVAGDWDACVFKVDMQFREPVPETVVLPNVFTPNNDGINDDYETGLRYPKEFELRIYDRWGAEMFSTNDVHTPWDGTTNGRPCEEGVYFVVLTYTYCSDPITKQTFVHLFR